jgi:multicomponent Na+:H+ antiporter subunit C
MSIFQTAIILFWVSIGVKEGATIPILTEADQVEVGAAIEERREDTYTIVEPDRYANPLPHVLMLTAIVVGVSTLGLALAIVQRIYSNYGTLEEDEILEQIKPRDHV